MKYPRSIRSTIWREIWDTPHGRKGITAARWGAVLGISARQVYRISERRIGRKRKKGREDWFSRMRRRMGLPPIAP